MSTGAIPTPQQLPAQLAQSLHHQQPPPPQTPHVQPHPPHGVSPHPMPMQLHGHAQFPVQQYLQNRHRILLQQQAAAASAARSGEGLHQNLQQPPATAQSVSSMSAPQQAMSPQPAALSNGMPAAKPMPPPQPPAAISASAHQAPPQEQTLFSVPNPQRSPPSGQAILRLLEFADKMSPGEQATAPAFWDQFAEDFFTSSSVLKLGLWSAHRNTNEFYELTRPTVPSFFLQHYACHVTSMQMTFERSNETISADESVDIDCAHASLIHRYQNGEMVVLTGHLEARFRRMDDGVYKIEKMEIRCSAHAEFIERTRMAEMLAVTPKTGKTKGAAAAAKSAQNESPVNEWGIPSKLYEWLKMAEMMSRIDEVMFYSLVTNATPRESLQSLAYEATLQSPENGGSGGNSGKGGGKVKVTKRDTKTKERPKLTRQKSTRTKKPAATDKSAAKIAGNAAGNEVAFTAGASNNNKNKNTIGGNTNPAGPATAATGTTTLPNNANPSSKGNNLSPVVKTQNPASVTNTPMQMHSQLPIASAVAAAAAFSPQHQMQIQQHQMMLQQQQQQQQQAQALYQHRQQALLQQQMAAASIPQQHTSTAYHAPYPAQLHQPGV